MGPCGGLTLAVANDELIAAKLETLLFDAAVACEDEELVDGRRMLIVAAEDEDAPFDNPLADFCPFGWQAVTANAATSVPTKEILKPCNTLYPWESRSLNRLL